MPRSRVVTKASAHVLRPSEPTWPKQLARLAQPPERLRILGELPNLAGAVAVVGTRYADDAALEFAYELGRDFASSGRTVISGGARGIDAAAHRGALAIGGPTVAVLATGFDRPFPREHAGLFREIADAGACVTEYDDGSPAVGWAFLARNRLIAALADAVVVVEAPSRSGALSTAAWGFKLEKQVFSVPYAPWEIRGQGCLGLLRKGALICTSARDVLSVRAPDGAGSIPGSLPDSGENSNNLEQLDPDSREVYATLSRTPQHPDKLAAALGMTIMRVQSALLQLLLLGLAVEKNPGLYSKITRPTRNEERNPEA